MMNEAWPTEAWTAWLSNVKVVDGRVWVQLRDAGNKDGVAASMIPEQARQFAAMVLECADAAEEGL